jgi:hypothetical protein
MNTERSRTSIGELLTEVSDLVVGLGIMTMAVAPFAIPVLVLVLAPLAIVGLLMAIVAAVAVPPVLLIRLRVRRQRDRRAAGPARTATRLSPGPRAPAAVPAHRLEPARLGSRARP